MKFVYRYSKNVGLWLKDLTNHFFPKTLYFVPNLDSAGFL